MLWRCRPVRRNPKADAAPVVFGHFARRQWKVLLPRGEWLAIDLPAKF
jgi:hypothetical protein